MERKFWCCRKTVREGSTHGGPRWMRLAHSDKWKNDKWWQSRRPAYSLLAEPTVTCFPANVWNWLQAAGKPAIPLWCSYVFAQQLLQQFHMPTADLTAFIHQKPDFKLDVPGHVQLYTVIYIKWSLRKCLWLSEYNWPFTSRNTCLPSNWGSTCVLRNAIKHVVLLMHATFFSLKKLAILQVESK